MTVVGLDVGTSGVKGLALSEAGEVLARAEAGYPLSTPRPGWAEQDPEDWWRAAQEVLAQLPAAEGIGLSGQMHGLVALDEQDAVLRPAILWNDGRTAAECAEIEARVPDLLARTGNRALPGFTAPKLLWLERHEPGTYASIASVLLPKDLVRLRLTGEHAIDVADASGTLLFDVAARGWSREVCDALGVPEAWLPRALECGAVSGEHDGVPVAAGAGDQAAGALGVGVVAPGEASVVLGTSGVVFSPLAAFAADERLHTFCHVEGWHAMGVVLSAAGALRWVRDTIAPGVPFDALVAEAERWAPGCAGLRFLPHLAGERTPHADPDARGAWTGLALHHDRGALVRAVLEGVAFALRDCADLLPPLVTARVSGGGARSDLWLRIVASVLERPLERTAADEGAAYGAALLGGVAAGVWASPREAAAATVRTTTTVEPDPAWTGPYRELHAAWRALYPALKGAA
jgi:xylulokinase